MFELAVWYLVWQVVSPALASHPIHDERLEIRELFTEELLVALPASQLLLRFCAFADR